MDFSLTEEQSMFRDTVERFLRDNYDFSKRRMIMNSELGWSPDTWRGLADLGVLAGPFAEDIGGLGGGAIETMLIMEAFGRALVIEPYIATIVLCGGVLRRSSTSLARDMISAVMEGEAILAFAYAEPQGRHNPANLLTTARRQGSGWRLSGHKAVVIGAPWADRLIVTARTDGDQTDEKGISLFLVDKTMPGVTSRDYTTIDGQRASEFYFENTILPADFLLCEEGEGFSLIEQVLDEAAAAVCAEAIGVMREMHAATMEYAKQRRQFGQAISEFQVLRHRMVDMFVALEQSISMSYLATLSLDRPAEERAAAVSSAKVQISNACRQIGQGALQIHGGMGQTDELAVGWYFKRATVIESQFGSADYHLRRYHRLVFGAGGVI